MEALKDKEVRKQNCIQYVSKVQATSRWIWNGHCSDQWSFLQLLNTVGKSDWKWRGILKKEPLVEQRY